MFKLVDDQVLWTRPGTYTVDAVVSVGLISLRNNRSVIVFTDEFRAALLHVSSTAGLLKIMTVLEELREFLLEIEENQ